VDFPVPHADVRVGPMLSTCIVERLNQETNAALSDSKMKERLAASGGETLQDSPAECGQFIAEETEKRAKVVKFSGAKSD
jgi:hypothetical protein